MTDTPNWYGSWSREEYVWHVEEWRAGKAYMHPRMYCTECDGNWWDHRTLPVPGYEHHGERIVVCPSFDEDIFGIPAFKVGSEFWSGGKHGTVIEVVNETVFVKWDDGTVSDYEQVMLR